MLKIKKALLILAAVAAPLIFGSGLAFADNPAKSVIQQGACDAAGQSNCDPAAATSSLDGTIKSIVNILSIAVGVIAVIMIIVGGFRYITSAGNEQGVAVAKRTLLYALIGLVIVALAQVIVRFVLTRTTNQTSTSSSNIIRLDNIS